MIFVYIGVPIVIIIVLGLVLVKKQDKKRRQDIYDTLEAYGTLSHHTYTINDDTFEIHLLPVSGNAELIINSPTIWEVRNGSTSRLIHQQALKNNKEKLIIVYPLTQPIKRYINENEMVFINYKDYFHHMHIIRMDELIPFLEERKS